VHLLLSGLIGIMLGWAAFPAVAVGLFLQAILFGFGGMVSLGANTMNMAAPAVICGGLFRLAVVSRCSTRTIIVSAGVLGGFGVILTALFVAMDLRLSGREFLPAAKLLVFAHLPVAAIEAVFSAGAVSVLLRSRPESLGFPEAPRPSIDIV
jgi:cobalt/nickel transport system permease protein